MLDAGICASMTLGAPRVSVDALRDLNRLLLVGDLRRSVSSDLPVAVVQEIQHEPGTKEAQDSSTHGNAVPPDEHRVRVDRTPRLDQCRAAEGDQPTSSTADVGGRDSRKGAQR